MDFVERSQAFAHSHIILHLCTRHVHDDFRVQILDARIDVVDKIVYAMVLQANGIEHSRWSLDHARIRISLTMADCGALHDDAAKTVQVDKISKLLTISESA